MHTRTAAYLIISCIIFFLLLSISFGFNNYIHAKQSIISNLNYALQNTISKSAPYYMSQDSIRAYSHLARIYGNPLIIESYNQDFYLQMQPVIATRKCGIRVQVYDPTAEFEKSPALDDTKYLTSDTLLWASTYPSLEVKDAYQSPISLSFQGYADCSFIDIIGIMDKKEPVLFLLLAMFLCTFSIYFHQKRSIVSVVSQQPAILDSNCIAVGNLILQPEESNFYLSNQERLKLTPMQTALMRLFFESSTHILTRNDICKALWPGKVNADETLNTLVRRLRPILETNTNLRITTDRGKAYVLEVI